VLLECDDGKSYVVKGKQAGRMITNDQILGALGHALGGPVPVVVLVDVPQELIDAEPEMSHMSAGVAHGSAWIPDASDREGIAHQDVAENRQRFAFLAVLYGWAPANDAQFIYTNAAPRLVYSVDHGHFFPGGPDWTIDTLNAASPADLDGAIDAACTWTAGHLRAVLTHLENFTDEAIADVVSRPPDDWNVSQQERSVLATYLAERRDQLCKKLDERISNA